MREARGERLTDEPLGPGAKRFQHRLYFVNLRKKGCGLVCREERKVAGDDHMVFEFADAP